MIFNLRNNFQYTYITSVFVDGFTKLLDVTIDGNTLISLFDGSNNNNDKCFDILIVDNFSFHLLETHQGFKFFKSQNLSKVNFANTSYNISQNLNISLVEDNKLYYIFVRENKTKIENREDKLNSIL